MEGKSKGRWSDEEHARYLKGVEMYGTNFKVLEAYVQTRTAQQIRTHHQHELKKSAKNTLKGAVRVAALSSSVSKKRKVEEKEKGDSKKAKSGSTVLESIPASLASQSPPCEVSETSSFTEKPLPSIPKQPKVVIPKSSPAKEDTVDETDEMKPPAVVPIAIEDSKTTESTHPETVEPVVPDSSKEPKAEEEANQVIEPTLQQKVRDLFHNEDFQSILAGFLGFITVIIMRELFM